MLIIVDSFRCLICLIPLFFRCKVLSDSRAQKRTFYGHSFFVISLLSSQNPTSPNLINKSRNQVFSSPMFLCFFSAFAARLSLVIRAQIRQLMYLFLCSLSVLALVSVSSLSRLSLVSRARILGNLRLHYCFRNFGRILVFFRSIVNF